VGPPKVDANFRKRGITFDQAIGVFYDPMVVRIEDERVAYIERRENMIRIIKARLTTPRERRR
jgi:uncharacterized DUF497 family protein